MKSLFFKNEDPEELKTYKRSWFYESEASENLLRFQVYIWIQNIKYITFWYKIEYKKCFYNMLNHHHHHHRMTMNKKIYLKMKHFHWMIWFECVQIAYFGLNQVFFYSIFYFILFFSFLLFFLYFLLILSIESFSSSWMYRYIKLYISWNIFTKHKTWNRLTNDSEQFIKEFFIY